MYERECQEKKVWEMCFYLTERHYQGFFFIQGICISSWPLTVHLRAVLFGMFVEMYIKLWGRGAFSQNHEGCECQPLLTPLCSICKAKCPRHSVQFFKTNIFFSWISFACLCWALSTFSKQLGSFRNLRRKEVKKSWEQCLCVSSPVGLRCGQMSAFCPLLMSGFLSPTGALTQRQVTGPDLSIDQCRHTHHQSLRQRFKEEEDDTACSLSKIKDIWRLCCNLGTEKMQ